MAELGNIPQPNHSDTLIVIEGLRAFMTIQKDEKNKIEFMRQYPEISHALDFCAENNLTALDPIFSFNTTKVIRQAYKESAGDLVTDIEISRLVTSWLSKFYNREYIKDFCKYCYEHEAKEAGREANPAWLKDMLNNKSFEDIMKEYTWKGKNTEEEINLTLDKLCSNLPNIKRISNNISQKNLISYLRDNPNFKNIYALVGYEHTEMFDNNKSSQILECVNKEFTSKRVVRLEIEYPGNVKGSVNIKIFGGHHGKLNAMQELWDEAEKDGLTIPKTRLEDILASRIKISEKTTASNL